MLSTFLLCRHRAEMHETKGMMVYLEFGTGLPRNGGEKNYLEFVYTRPKFLVTGFYVSFASMRSSAVPHF